MCVSDVHVYTSACSYVICVCPTGGRLNKQLDTVQPLVNQRKHMAHLPPTMYCRFEQLSAIVMFVYSGRRRAYIIVIFNQCILSSSEYRHISKLKHLPQIAHRATLPTDKQTKQQTKNTTPLSQKSRLSINQTTKRSRMEIAPNRRQKPNNRISIWWRVSRDVLANSSQSPG